jgi:hypothetical protein
MVLYTCGSVIIAGSNIWIIADGLSSTNIMPFAASNIVSVFSIGVGAILTQVDLWNKNKHLRSLKSDENNTDII